MAYVSEAYNETQATMDSCTSIRYGRDITTVRIYLRLFLCRSVEAMMLGLPDSSRIFFALRASRTGT